MKNKNAFTLAEVLITLGIIGVVAAMTLPTLVQKQQEKATVTALKKFYSTISQAYLFAINEKGTVDNWGFTTGKAKELLTTIEPYLKFIKYCEVGEKCHPEENVVFRNGTTYINEIFNPINEARVSATLSDGSIIGAYLQSPDCSIVYGNSKALSNVCGEYMIDINGGKKPNQYGKDIFIFNITKYGIIPNGTENYTFNKYNFNDGCLNKSSEGFGCTAWVIYNENTDYFKCDDLAWDGKKKCK